ncbi:MAG: glycosyltransferase [Candidatus Hodarchaeales archaeon]
MSLVTVGVCVKNEEATIEKAIKSILEQIYPHNLIEVIIVDDGCTDNTIGLVKKIFNYTDIPMKIINSGGKGLGTARQLVVDKAEGDFILWLDGDMEVSNEYIRLNINFLMDNPNIAKVRGKWQKDEGNNLVSYLENLNTLADQVKRNRLVQFTGTGASIFRVSAIKDVGGFDTNINGAGEDIDLSARIWNAGWKFAETSVEYYHGDFYQWKDIWRKYWWYGYGMHYVINKHKRLIFLWSHFPLVSFFIGIFRSVKIYKMTRSNISYLLPIYYFFKRTAWFLGFIKSHMDGYGHINVVQAKYEI